MHQDSEACRQFPPSPFLPTERLVPISSWADMYREASETGVEFDLFWYELVMAGVAYFFRWQPEPRATVLVIWEDTEPVHIECRKRGDVLVSESELEPVLGEVVHAFRNNVRGRRIGRWQGIAFDH